VVEAVVWCLTKNQDHASMPQSERGLELAKLHLDTFKHITTFCSGAILLTATVVAALFPDPIRVWALTLSLLFFVRGVTFALGDLVFTIFLLDAHPQTPVSKVLSVLLTLSVVWAYLGVMSFGFFAGVNLGALG
jgi:hypothetical protein